MKRDTLCLAIIAAPAIIMAAIACTFDVGQPQITIDCVEVEFPGLQTTYCKDAGAPKSSGSKDAGTDSREQ